MATMARTLALGSIKNNDASRDSEGMQSTTQLSVLSTIFSTMFVSSVKPPSLPQTTPATRLERKSEFSEVVHDIWHSIFNWAFVMLIITPKPDIRRINKYRQRQSKTNGNSGFLSQLSHLVSVVQGLFSTMVKRTCATLRLLFTSKFKPQPPILSHFVPRPTRVDTPLEAFAAASSTIHNTPGAIQTPIRAVLPTHRVSKSDPISPKISPTTAHFLATLADLEAQIHNHQFYDLEGELEKMDNQMSHVFDFAWIPSPPRSPIPMILPQAPPPARRDGRTMEILPMIYEVSENSTDMGNAPPYDPRRWSIVTFQPMWGPRVQAGEAY